MLKEVTSKEKELESQLVAQLRDQIEYMKKDITHKNLIIELLVAEIRSKHNKILNVSHKRESIDGNTDMDIINSTVANEIIPSENYASDNSNVDSRCISELQLAKSNQSTWRVVRGKNKN